MPHTPTSTSASVADGLGHTEGDAILAQSSLGVASCIVFGVSVVAFAAALLWAVISGFGSLLTSVESLQGDPPFKDANTDLDNLSSLRLSWLSVAICGPGLATVGVILGVAGILRKNVSKQLPVTGLALNGAFIVLVVAGAMWLLSLLVDERRNEAKPIDLASSGIAYPPSPPATVEIEFEVDADGVLHCAGETSTDDVKFIRGVLDRRKFVPTVFTFRVDRQCSTGRVTELVKEAQKAAGAQIAFKLPAGEQ